MLWHPEVEQLLKAKATFDVVINSVFVANEVGYYLAHKFNSTLVLYFTLQCSNINIDLALGQPHSPAIMSPMCYGYKYFYSIFLWCNGIIVFGLLRAKYLNP